MSTRHVILALLSVKPMTGYELAQNMKLSLDSLWAATHSQIYPTLHKLAGKGLVSGEKEIRGRHMERIVYSLTEAGYEEFETWLVQPLQYLPFRDPFKLWASYMDACPPEVVFHNISEHLRLHRQRARTLEQIADSIVSGEHPLIRARAERLPAEQVERIKQARSMIYYELAKQARFEIESVKRIREQAEALFPDYQPDEDEY